MEKKDLLRLLVVLLGLSYVVYAAAVPATRISPLTRKVDPSVQDHQAKEDLVMDLRNSEELFDIKEGLEEGRMNINMADYPQPRANPAHDPKSPGKP